MTDEPRRKWRFYKSGNDSDVARREFDGLPEYAHAGLAELMQRYKNGEQMLPREVGHYKGGVRALRFSWSHNEWRCYFAHEGQRRLLALAFTGKKTESADTGRAKARLADWRERGRTKRAGKAARERLADSQRQKGGGPPPGK